MRVWLHIIGINPDGMNGLNKTAQSVLKTAEIIIGSARHHRLIDNSTAQRIHWPSPFDALIDQIKTYRGKQVALLTTGDPLWYSIGVRLAGEIDKNQILYHPQVSAFQLTAARLGWAMVDIETLSLHARPCEIIIPFLQPNQRLIMLTTDEKTPKKIVALLNAQGFGASIVHVFNNMNGQNESHVQGTAVNWKQSVSAFNTVAIECVFKKNTPLLPRVAGLCDTVFHHDGTITKQEVRAITLSALMPMPRALLWDVGCGCGSVSIEWMRSHRSARAIAIESRPDRRTLTLQNALSLGTPKLEIIAATAPEGLTSLATPDAIFIGGGLSYATIEICLKALNSCGRLVCNAVTLDSESLLVYLHKKYGGQLRKIQISRAKIIGNHQYHRGWQALRPIIQWSLIKS